MDHCTLQQFLYNYGSDVWTPYHTLWSRETKIPMMTILFGETCKIKTKMHNNNSCSFQCSFKITTWLVNTIYPCYWSKVWWWGCQVSTKTNESIDRAFQVRSKQLRKQLKPLLKLCWCRTDCAIHCAVDAILSYTVCLCFCNQGNVPLLAQYFNYILPTKPRIKLRYINKKRLFAPHKIWNSYKQWLFTFTCICVAGLSVYRWTTAHAK